MSKKFSAARKRAFLEALAESGNQTLSAERAKVSRSWVQLHRSTDAAFDAACRAAIAGAKARLGAAREREPAAGWRYTGGAELVVSGSNGRRTQLRRARLRQWTPRVEQRFLLALATTCNVKAACAEAGMSASSAYAHRKRWPAFAYNWNLAVEIAYCELDAAALESAECFLSGAPLPADNPVRVTSVTEVIQLLNMHKFAVKGEGRPPGVRRSR